MDDRAILESISDGVFTVDPEFRITYLNRSAGEMIHILPEEAVGQLCCDVFHSSLCETGCPLRKTLDENRPVIDLSCFIISNEGRKIPISISTAVLRDDRGNVIGGAETFRNLSDLKKLQSEIDFFHQLGDFASRSSSMQKMFSQLEAVAGSTATVLITGETGSGKELLANTIHNHSPRRDKPFVAINCGAFPETLLESELFGYQKGAFTGADRDKPGRFALAEGGTLFLDEIGEISPAMQIRLLRVLQERSFEPLGGTKSIKSDVRIIAATHRDLETRIREGLFRQDLFYRINVIHLELPPLRRRREDIEFLVEHFINRFNRLMHKDLDGISSSALKILNAFDWPGNIRELENVIERSMVFCRGRVINVEDLPDYLNGRATVTTSGNSIRRTIQATELAAIRDALRTTGGNRRQAAQLLGIDHTTFYRKLKKLGPGDLPPDGRKRGKNDTVKP